MKGFRKAIGLTILLIWLLPVKTYPATIETYVSKSSYSTLLSAQQTNDSVGVGMEKPIKLKDPKMAVFYAIIPGIVVHGSGHFYAGRIGTGFLLLGTEVVGVSFLFYAAVSSFAVIWEGEYDREVELWAIGGLVLFMGSWVCDMVGSPIAVKKQNEKLLQRKQGALKFQMKDGQLKLAIMKNF